MTHSRKRGRDLLRADAATVSQLLAKIKPEDVITRLGLEARLAEIQRELANFQEDEEEDRLAAIALYFGGRPVVDALGIESEFATSALSKFQDIVAKVLAQEAGGALGQRGPVPTKGASILHITNVARGSFGFVLEEIRQQQQILDTSLKVAVDEAARLLDAFGEPNEEQFRSAAEAIDERVLRTAGDFFELMQKNQATLRLVATNSEKSFGPHEVTRAAERAKSTEIEEFDQDMSGVLAGMLPEGHQFEFKDRAEGRTIAGKIIRSISTQEAADLNARLLNKACIARIHVKRVTRNGSVARESFTLLEIREDDSPTLTSNASNDFLQD
jgi:hypothetical protein